jgi:hypothetical protein
MSQSFKQKIFRLLCFCLLISVFFTNLLHLPFVQNKVQLTEILFVILLPFIPYKELVGYHIKNNRTFILLVSGYLLFDMISSLLSKQWHSIFESAGRIYLVIVFMILCYHFSKLNLAELFQRLQSVVFFCTITIAVIAVTGYAIAYFAKYLFVSPFFNYPYFGTVYRFRGPTVHPSMMINVLVFLFCLAMGLRDHIKNRAIQNMGLALLGICAVLTFSKSIILIFFGLLIFFLQSKKILGKKLLLGTAFFFTVLLIVVTHFVFTGKDTLQIKNFDSTNFTSGKILYQAKHFTIMEAGYLAIKRVEIDLAGSHLFFGVGTGNFNQHLHWYKVHGRFPEKLPDFDPHSTYLGALVENGLFAFLLLLAVFIFVFRFFIKQKNLVTDRFLLSLFIIYLAFLMDGISTDVLNFRHLWVFFAITFAYVGKEKVNPLKI